MNKTKTAVVLGASGVIGQAVCQQLARDGWSIYLHYHRNKNSVSRLQKTLNHQFPHQQFLCVRADFRTETGGQKLADSVQKVQAVIVANGQSHYSLLDEMSPRDMEGLWRVHMQNPAYFISLVAPQLRMYKKSYVVFIGSIWGSIGAANEVMYSAVKGAQHAFVKAYAKEAAYSGIRVNGIAPGWIESPMNEQFTEEELVFVKDQIPLQQIGQPQDIANAVCYLINGQADYVTGEIIKINGGWYM